MRNSGTLVDQFSMDIVGDAKEWAEVEPGIINLMPGQEAELTVTFSPPRNSSVPAGLVPFGVRVISREDGQTGSVVEEGAVEVEPFADLQVELTPKTSRCRTKARHEVVVDNAGNYPVGVEVVTNDPDEQLKLKLDHSALTVQPGTSAFLKLTAKPHDRFLKGAERRHPFTVTAVTTESPPITTQGTVVQQQMLPRWLLPALIALLALAIVAVTLWFTVVRPTVQSAAREAATEQAKVEQAALEQKASDAEEKAAAAEQKAAAAEQKAADNPGQGQPPPPPVTGPNSVDIAKGAATDFRVVTDATQTGNPTAFTRFEPQPAIDPAKTLVVTDLVLQNPRGDSGTLQIRRGDQILLEFGLANFRDLDYHFLQPLTFGPAQKLIVAVNCAAPGAPVPADNKCRPAVSFTGRLAG